MENLQKILEGLGLGSKEASVYLACLELGDAVNAGIAKRTKLNRITNYEVLKRLEKRGLVSSYVKKGAKYFMAVDPRSLVKQVKEKVALAEQSMPEFLAILNQLTKKPRIYFFEGVEGIKNIYEDSLNAKTEILTFTNPKDIRALLGDEYIDGYVAERLKRKIPVRGLAPDDQAGKREKEIGQKVLRQARLFPKEKYKVSQEIMIYDDKIAIFSGKDEMGLIVESKELASSFRAIWQMAWDNAVGVK